MEKPGDWFAIAKMWKKHPKEKNLKKGSMQINHLVSPYKEDQLQMGYSKQLMG